MTIATKAAAHDHTHADHAGHDHAAHDHAKHDHAKHDHAAHDAPHAHAHSHSHSHSDETANAPRRANPGFSLLRMSSLQRLALAHLLVAAIWLSVFWAWS